jgi:hypothetical protein
VLHSTFSALFSPFVLGAEEPDEFEEEVRGQFL